VREPLVQAVEKDRRPRCVRLKHEPPRSQLAGNFRARERRKRAGVAQQEVRFGMSRCQTKQHPLGIEANPDRFSPTLYVASSAILNRLSVSFSLRTARPADASRCRHYSITFCVLQSWRMAVFSISMSERTGAAKEFLATRCAASPEAA